MAVSRGRFKVCLYALLMLCSFVLFSAVAVADQGFYVLDKTARPGMLMSLAKNPDVVEPATTENAELLVGALSDNSTTLSIAPDQVPVKTDGVATVLVSTMDGDIEVGDRISPSSISGVGTKNTKNGWIIGVAQTSFDEHSNGAVKYSATDSAGGKRDVHVGTISVIVKVTYYNAQTAAPSKSVDSVIPDKLQSIADSLIGRHASQLAVILSSALMIIGLLLAGLIVNAAVRNGIRATARQPLAKSAILKRMIQSCVIGLILLMGAVGAAFIIIRTL